MKTDENIKYQKWGQKSIKDVCSTKIEKISNRFLVHKVDENFKVKARFYFVDRSLIFHKFWSKEFPFLTPILALYMITL